MNPIIDLDALRLKLRSADLTPARRQALQRELAEHTTPADRAELDALLRRLPAAETAEIRDLLFR
jgi:hypothetical protein